MLDVDSFREKFPQFDEGKFPAPAIELRLAVAREMYTPYSLKNESVAELFQGLYVAHCLTYYGSSALGGDGSASASAGVISSKSVDGVSVSFDTSSASEQGAGFYNSTQFGRELYRLMRTFGAGAVIV